MTLADMFAAIPALAAFGIILGLVLWCSAVAYWIADIRRTLHTLQRSFVVHRHIEVDGRTVVWWPTAAESPEPRPAAPSFPLGHG